MARHPHRPATDWLRRAAMVALAALVCGCASFRFSGIPAEPAAAPSPPSAPEAAASAPRVVAANAHLSPAVLRAIEQVLQQPSDHPRAAVVDFAAHSSTPRFHVIDRATGEVVHSFRVAHGHGSEGKRDGYAEVFSNVPNSNASSLGLYRTAEVYRSDVYPGLAMRLDGLSPTNSNARARFIVIHEARYMEPHTWKGKKTGRPGLSDGCFAFSKDDRDAVLTSLQGGALIYAVYEKP